MTIAEIMADHVDLRANTIRPKQGGEWQYVTFTLSPLQLQYNPLGPGIYRAGT